MAGKQVSTAQHDVLVGLAKKRWRVFHNNVRGQIEFCQMPWVNDRYRMNYRTVLRLEALGLIRRLDADVGMADGKAFVFEQEFVLTDRGREVAMLPAAPERGVRRAAKESER